MRSACLALFISCALLSTACARQDVLTEPLVQTPASAAVTSTFLPQATPTRATATAMMTISVPTERTISCEDWQTWPVVPAVSDEMRSLYRRGQADGKNPRAFSKIGDGEISAEWFFTAFDLGATYYDLGIYQGLAPVIEYFSGSFERIGTAARSGFNTVRILDPGLGSTDLCATGESPLTCEVRLHRPAFAILSLGTNQIWRPEEFQGGMRQILDTLLSEHVVPILSTKGDNLEGDHRINRILACLAQEYEIPLWNFWAAIQPLPDHGLQADREHLTYGVTDFDDERAMGTAWTVRNLTALQALDAVWRTVTTQP